MMVEDASTVHGIESLDSFEAQAARVAGMAREREREQARLECAIASDALASEKPAVDTDVLMLIEGLHRRATGAPASTRHASVDEDDGDNGLFVVVRKKRKRKKLDPYEKIPFFVAEIMQWAHTFLSLKFLYYALVFDQLEESGYALVFCVAYSLLVLDWFKNPDGLGIGTMTNSYFIYRMTRGLAKINSFIAAALLIEIEIWTIHVMCLLFVSFFAIQGARESAFLYYGCIVLWEFAVLPTVCYMRTINEDFDRDASALSDVHMVWCAALFSAICLHPFDPYTLGWRDKLHVIDRRLRVPYDPVFY